LTLKELHALCDAAAEQAREDEARLNK